MVHFLMVAPSPSTPAGTAPWLNLMAWRMASRASRSSPGWVYGVDCNAGTDSCYSTYSTKQQGAKGSEICSSHVYNLLRSVTSPTRFHTIFTPEL